VDEIAPYQKIANALRDRILSGELEPGAKLPSETELAKEHEVVRNTAARAIKQLRSEGLITSAQGAVSRVRSRPLIVHLASGENFRARQKTGKSNDLAEAEAQNYKGKNKLLWVREMAAPPEVARLLVVQGGAPVVVRCMLNHAQGEPMKLLRCYYRQEFAAGTPLAAPRLIKGGVANLLESADGPFRRTIARFTESVELRMPRPDEAEQLVVPDGVPVARILRTLYDETGEALEVLDSLLPGDRFVLKYEIEVPEKF
jgi:GntR family transcriptional regulator